MYACHIVLYILHSVKGMNLKISGTLHSGAGRAGRQGAAGDAPPGRGRHVGVVKFTEWTRQRMIVDIKGQWIEVSDKGREAIEIIPAGEYGEMTVRFALVSAGNLTQDSAYYQP